MPRTLFQVSVNCAYSETLQTHSVTLLPTGCKNEKQGEIFKELMQTPNFRITVVLDSDTVEICGALKVSDFKAKCSY